MSPPYTPSVGHDQKHYVKGPGSGCGYYDGALFQDMRLSNEKDAKAASAIANVAYREGYEAAQRDICKALGIKQ